MTLLSVVIITKNEEKNIGRCLESVQAIADEIIVVDSFSEDRTAEICNQYNTTFIQNAFEGHIQQKNFALDKAKHKLVLSLDADEAIDLELQEAIQAVKSMKDPAHTYILRRKNRYCGQWIRHGSWYPDKRVRLVNKNYARWGGYNPHDVLESNSGKAPVELKGHILHFTIENLEEHIRQINYFTTVVAQSKFTEGQVFKWHKLIFGPPLRFVKEFFFKLGFMDGYLGFQIAFLSGVEAYLRYAKLRELTKQNRKPA